MHPDGQTRRVERQVSVYRAGGPSKPKALPRVIPTDEHPMIARPGRRILETGAAKDKD
jgi:hypothetical protein